MKGGSQQVFIVKVSLCNKNTEQRAPTPQQIDSSRHQILRASSSAALWSRRPTLSVWDLTSGIPGSEEFSQLPFLKVVQKRLCGETGPGSGGRNGLFGLITSTFLAGLHNAALSFFSCPRQ